MFLQQPCFYPGNIPGKSGSLPFSRLHETGYLIECTAKGGEVLQIHVEIEDGQEEVVITIKCKEKSAYIDRLVAAMNMVDRRIAVTHRGSH